MASNFTSVPILDWALTSDPLRRDEFVAQLRHAVINVGFLYVSNASVPKADIDRILEYIPKLFEIPQDAKDAISMENSPHFLGYSRLGTELTKGQTDHREQFDFATPHVCRWRGPSDPDYLRHWGRSQWPDERFIPGFKQAMERYLLSMEEFSYKFSSLLAEALGLPPNGLDGFYDISERMQHWSKIVRYPPSDRPEQGVGPHTDSGFLTFLLQASPHEGLQVQNLAGKWIDVPPIPGTFVVNIGKALEFVTQGLARATCHRVLLAKGDTPRFSMPFFQNIRQDVKLAESVLDFPPEILKLREARGDVAAYDSVNFSEFDREPSGMVSLIGRIKSHPQVAKRHYPELFQQFFPNGV